MRTLFAAVLLLSVCLIGCGSHGAMQTTTTQNVTSLTMASQTANNTSASSRFQSQRNGNLGANNVSKVDVHSLLYPGTRTKVYAQLLVWFGQSDHIDVGYNSADPDQVHRQITDMISRGIDGVIVDWYGPNNSIDNATQLVMLEAEKPGFSFSIMIRCWRNRAKFVLWLHAGMMTDSAIRSVTAAIPGSCLRLLTTGWVISRLSTTLG